MGAYPPANRSRSRPPAVLSLADSGATDLMHPTDAGAIENTWKPATKSIQVGDSKTIACYGSVLKLFLPAAPYRGPPLPRRVLIVPEVFAQIWSISAEVDVYKSSYHDTPDACFFDTKDNHRVSIIKASSRLRWIQGTFLPGDGSIAMTVAAGFTPPSPPPACPKAQAYLLQRATDDGLTVTSHGGLFSFVTGVGKPPVKLTLLEHLRLWHVRLGHLPLRRLLQTLKNLKHLNLIDAKWNLADLRTFSLEPCDVCNAHKQRQIPTQRVPHRPWSADAKAAMQPSPRRALKPLRRFLLDVFGKVAFKSIQHHYQYLLGFWDEATGFRWLFGTKIHTTEECERITQLLRAALRNVLGEVEIIRTDNAPEFASERWSDFLADGLMAEEHSIAYDARAMGGVERTWLITAPSAGCLLSQFGAGRNHWYTACAHSLLLANASSSDVVTIDGTRTTSSAHYRLWGFEFDVRKLRCYGAPVRFLLDATQWDSKFDERARAGHYVGVSPSNASAMYVWDGHQHVTVGGASIVDESDFIKPLVAPADRIENWPKPDVHDEPDYPKAQEKTKSTSTPSRDRFHPDALENGTHIEFRYLNDDDDWQWYDSTVEDSRVVSSTGRRHHYVKWTDRREGWNTHDWVDLYFPGRVWRLPKSAKASPPLDSAAAPAPPKPPVTSRPQPTPAVAPSNPSKRAALRTPPSNDTSLGYSLRRRANMAALFLTAATTTWEDRRDAQQLSPDLAREAAILGAVSDTEHEPDDILAALRDDSLLTECLPGDLPPIGQAPDPVPTDEPEIGPSSTPFDPPADVAARLAVACVHGTEDWTALDEASIHDLRSCAEVYVFELDSISDHPALLAAKARTVTATRRTVVYYTPEGVARAIEPKNVKEALNSLEHDQWVNAINVEIENLKSHGAYHLVPASEPLAKGKKILNMTFVFKIKVKEDLSLEKFKARLCVVGSGMEEGSDYFEKYAACARTTSIKLVVITTVVNDWIDFHFDLHGAFLTADIDADVYCHQPRGLPTEDGPNGERMVWKLDKAIYGTVQAARLFTQKLRTALLEIGFRTCTDDENIYRLDHRLGRITLSTHIDDGIGGASNQAVLDHFYTELKRHGFAFSAPPGPWSTVLGFGIKRDRTRRTVTFTANKHISALEEEHLADEPSPSCPRTPDSKEIMELLPAPLETPAEEAALAPMRTKARALKGSLIYIGFVHPGIVHACSRVCAFMAKPTHRSYACARRILMWLSGRKELGVTFGGPAFKSVADLLPQRSPLLPLDPHRDGSLACCVDSDLNGRSLPQATASEAAQNPPDHASSRSQLGYAFSIAGGCFEAISRRQHSVALDSAAAEAFAASTAAAQLINITGVLRFITFGVLGNEPVPLWCDNEVCVMVTKDQSSIKRLSYVARRVRFLQELHARGIVHIMKIDGKVNPADAFTKYLQPADFKRYMDHLYNGTTDANELHRRSIGLSPSSNGI